MVKLLSPYTLKNRFLFLRSNIFCFSAAKMLKKIRKTNEKGIFIVCFLHNEKSLKIFLKNFAIKKSFLYLCNPF